MGSRKLEDLHPDLQPLATAFLAECHAAGLTILITCTYRSCEEQDLLYSYGRTVPNRNNPDNPWSTVTNCRGGQSDHNYMLYSKPAAKAFDIVPLRDDKEVWKTYQPEWKKIAEIWQKGFKTPTHYLDWYGRPNTSYSDYPHFCLKELKP
jgi:peptidoglycan L-alanyl-D-glutamate endopeptidase CwlK